MIEKSPNIVLEKTFEFALEVINFCEKLEECKKYVISKQLLKSGTSIGANVREAQSTESKVDFIHKMKIAEKELLETEYWLLLCKQAANYPFDATLLVRLDEIKKIIAKIIVTTKNNVNRN